MSGDQNFQQRWGLRGQNDVDSSSDDSKLCSHDDLVLKKHRLVPSSRFPDNDKNKEISNSPLPHPGNDVLPKNGCCSKIGNVEKRRKQTLAILRKPTKSDMNKKGKKTKNTRCKFKVVSLDSLNAFTKTIIDELKVAREEMFARMNEEMELISHVKPISRPGKKKDSLVERVGKVKCKDKVETGKKARKSDGASLKKSVKSDKTKDSDKSCEIIDNGVSSSKNHGPGLVTETTKVNSSSVALKEPICNVSNGLVSSPFLNLPTPVSEQRAPNLIAPATKDGINLENAMFRHNEMPHQGYYPGNQISEQFQNISQMGFHNMNYFNQMRNQTMPSGFPLNLQQGSRNGFSFPSQVTENLSRQNDTFGLGNNGGTVRFSVGNNGFFGHYAGKNTNGKTG